MSPRPVGSGPLPTIAVSEKSHRDPDFLALDESTLNPSRHYRWVRCRSDEHMMAVTKTKLIGYSVETIREGGPRALTDTDERPDKVIAVGDLILMSCPQALFDKRQAAQSAKTEGLLASTSAATEQRAKELGIKVIKDAE